MDNDLMHNVKPKKNKPKGCCAVLVIIMLLIVIFPVGIKLFEENDSDVVNPNSNSGNSGNNDNSGGSGSSGGNSGGSGSSGGNSGGSITQQLITRAARNDDIMLEIETDLSSFGVKFVIMPQIDISDLELTIQFKDKNGKVLETREKAVGNVKEGLQVSFSISLIDMGWSLVWNTDYYSCWVSGGRVSYFAYF